MVTSDFRPEVKI